MTRGLVFVIPVRHPGSVRDWGVVRRDLGHTLASVAAQTNDDWECRVVVNRGADLPPMPPGCELRTVDLPLPVLPDRTADPEAYFDAIRHDKGLRLYEGVRDISPESYVMTVDFDDFVSRRLAAFVAARRAAGQAGPGWFLREGMVHAGGSWAFLTRRFHRLCGTSHLVRRDALGMLEHSDGAVDIEAVKRSLGAHVFIKDDLEAQGTPLEVLPFAGALYRIGNPQSTSGTGALFRTMTPLPQILRNPHRMLPALARYRPVGSALRAEFTLP